MELSLTIQSSEGTRTVPVVKDRLSLGRGEAADVRIDDGGLSRVHAVIYREGGLVWIIDENSTNGSFVNGAAVPEAGTPLSDGDRITLGDRTAILVSISAPGQQAKSAVAESESDSPRFAVVAAGVLIAALLVGALVLGASLLSGRAKKSQRRTSDYSLEETAGTPEKGGARTAPREDAGAGTNSAELTPDAPGPTKGSDPAGAAPVGPAREGERKLYLQMSEAERNEFVYERARHISRMMGNREYQFTDDVLPYITNYVDAYAKRVGNGSTRIWGEDLTSMFGRARKIAPFIVRSFNSRGVPPVVGLYIPMIESEYRECLESPVGAKGLYQFMAATARGYGVDPGDRCNAEKMAPAAAEYIKDRISEFGSDSMSVALGIAGYNRSPDSVRRDLHDVLNSENKERNFWTLVVNSNKLDRFFQNENIKYVPKFFAAAIVGETPWAFGLQMNPLSTYTQSTDAT
jgi:pSer/pThr/pTyr-binding forkhead associated (FHA) protein